MKNALKKEKFNYSRSVTLDEHASKDLEWWGKNYIVKMGVAIDHRNTMHDIEAFSDASMTGYGFTYSNNSLGNHWSHEDLQTACHHVNELELLAVYKGMLHFQYNYVQGENIVDKV